MNFIHILFYPFIAVPSFFGSLFSHAPKTDYEHHLISIYGRKSPDNNRETIHLSRPLLVSPFIENDQLQEAQQRSKVTPDIGGKNSYSGFFTVDQNCGNHLFFWFICAEDNWEKAPVILWLNGGPGGSSLFGLFNEVGPWKFRKGELIENKFSWTKISNLLFIDQPVGTGFSFSDKECFTENKQDVTEQLYNALIQFFKMFPKLQKNQFFMAGMSFAGHYIPETAALIDKKNKVENVKINLAGIIVGSPSVQRTCNHKGDLLYELGIVDEDDRDQLKALDENLAEHIRSHNYKEAEIVDSQINMKLQEIGLPNYFDILDDELEPETYGYTSFVTTSHIKEQIHVGDSSHEYNVINQDVFAHLQDSYFSSATSAVEYLLNKNYIVGFFNGQLDAICSSTYLECVFGNLNWDGSLEYNNAVNHPWFVSNQLAGWFKVVRNLFTVVIRRSGHNTPEDQGEMLFVLINSILNTKPGQLLLDLKVIK